MNAPSLHVPPGGTIDHILATLSSLVPSERRVAQECADHPEDVVEMSGADLAARTGTSPATVSRACQNLGFRGFQHLRILLVSDLAVRARADEPPADGAAGHLRSYFQGAARMIEGAVTTVDPAAFDAAAQAVAGDGRLLVVATGGSAPAAQAVALRLLMGGRPCEAPPDAVVQELTASVLKPGDVCLAVSESGANSVTMKAVVAAADAGATVVAVTGFAKSPLTAVADVSLVAGARFQAWDRASVGGNLVQMLLLSALQDAVAARMAGSERARAAVQDELVEIVSRDEEAVERHAPRNVPDEPAGH
ncbi:MurR/RpiR family transcriptional regulator [Promicromonospora sp. Marseille-Q5078]